MGILGLVLLEYGQMMVTKGPKLRRYQKWGYRMHHKQPESKIIKYSRNG